MIQTGHYINKLNPKTISLKPNQVTQTLHMELSLVEVNQANISLVATNRLTTCFEMFDTHLKRTGNSHELLLKNSNLKHFKCI